jgi:hypothetical protein
MNSPDFDYDKVREEQIQAILDKSLPPNLFIGCDWGFNSSSASEQLLKPEDYIKI